MGDAYPKLRLAAVQAAPVFLDREATIDKACRLILQAGSNGADGRYRHVKSTCTQSASECILNPEPGRQCGPIRGRMMALVDHNKLRANYDQLAATLAADETAGIVRPSVTTRLLGDVAVESTFVQYDRPFRFVSDEAIHRGGREAGPSPMRYFLSGLAFCLQGWYAKGSAFAECELESLELELRTWMDMRGEHAFDGVAPHPQWIVAEARVTSPSGPQAVLDMIDWGDARCPLGSLVRRSIPVYGRVVHNGTVIRDDIPSDLG